MNALGNNQNRVEEQLERREGTLRMEPQYARRRVRIHDSKYDKAHYVNSHDRINRLSARTVNACTINTDSEKDYFQSDDNLIAYLDDNIIQQPVPQVPPCLARENGIQPASNGGACLPREMVVPDMEISQILEFLAKEDDEGYILIDKPVVCPNVNPSGNVKAFYDLGLTTHFLNIFGRNIIHQDFLSRDMKDHTLNLESPKITCLQDVSGSSGINEYWKRYYNEMRNAEDNNVLNSTALLTKNEKILHLWKPSRNIDKLCHATPKLRTFFQTQRRRPDSKEENDGERKQAAFRIEFLNKLSVFPSILFCILCFVCNVEVVNHSQCYLTAKLNSVIKTLIGLV